ncbi:MAG: HpcH/HpaI aldolase family protein [Alphaproteobacteria bacterium]
MMPNGIRALWKDNKPAINGWLSIANSFSAEIMAAQGYDSVTVDTQHGVVDYQSVVTMFQAMRASGVTPMARVPWLDAGIIMKMLDAGAYGVICPMINSRREAEKLVSYVRYAPVGVRSFGPTRANISAGAGYAEEANDQILCFAMVETAEAMGNLVDIVTTPGLDAVYIGPADLTLSLAGGRLTPAFDREEPEMIEAIRKIADAAREAGIRAALHTGSADYAARAIGWGFDLVTISNDVRLLAGAAGASVARARELLDGNRNGDDATSGAY